MSHSFSEEEDLTDWLSQYASSNSDSTLFRNCTIGDYYGSFVLGSWKIKVQSNDNGVCEFDYLWEMEMGYTNYECKVLIDKIKITDWNLSAIPIEQGIVDNFCKKIKEGNFYLDQKQNRPNSDFYQSPLKQIKDGINIEDVKCRETFQLIFKYDDSPACVKPESIPKLIERRWATEMMQVLEKDSRIKYADYLELNPTIMPNSSFSIPLNHTENVETHFKLSYTDKVIYYCNTGELTKDESLTAKIIDSNNKTIRNMDRMIFFDVGCPSYPQLEKIENVVRFETFATLLSQVNGTYTAIVHNPQEKEMTVSITIGSPEWWQDIINQ